MPRHSCGDEKALAVLLGGRRDREFHRERRGRLVFPKHVGRAEGMRERLNAGGVEFFKERHKAHDLGEFAGHLRKLVFAEGEPRQCRNLGNVVPREAHGRARGPDGTASSTTVVDFSTEGSRKGA